MKKFTKWLHTDLIQVSGSHDTWFPSTGFFFIFGWTFPFMFTGISILINIIISQILYIQISQSQSRSLSDMPQPVFRISLWSAYRNIFNRVRVNTAIESCKWGDDSRATKPHCQKIPLPCVAQKKPLQFLFLTTFCQTKNKLSLVSQNLISTFRLSLFKCEEDEEEEEAEEEEEEGEKKRDGLQYGPWGWLLGNG